MIETKYGLKVKRGLNNLKVFAITHEGALALKTWIKLPDNIYQLRIKLDINEKEYPFFKIKQTLTGIIYMVEFWKNNK